MGGEGANVSDCAELCSLPTGHPGLCVIDFAIIEPLPRRPASPDREPPVPASDGQEEIPL